MSLWLGVSIGIMSSDSDIPVSPVPSDRRARRGNGKSEGAREGGGEGTAKRIENGRGLEGRHAMTSEQMSFDLCASVV